MHICKFYCLILVSLIIVIVEETVYGFFDDHNYKGGSGKFICKALLLEDNKQLLLNMIDRECTTRIAFLADGYILLKLPNHSLHSSILLYEGNTFGQKVKVVS